MLSSRNRNFGLDIVRATAIVLVLVSHCTYILPEFDLKITNSIRLLGATGVDIFFVLSGYLIGGIILNYINARKTSLKSFLHFCRRRWLRTLPNYAIVLILNIVLILLLEGDLNDYYLKYVVFIQNFAEPHPNFFTEAWSLSIEEFAYVFAPSLIFAGIHWFKSLQSSKVFFLMTCIFVLALFVFKIQFYLTTEIGTYKAWSSAYRKVVIYRLDAIYYGFLLVYLYRNYKGIVNYKYLLLAIGVLVFTIMHIYIMHFEVLPQANLLFYTLIYLPLISISIALTFPWVINLGTWKYGWPVVTFLSKRSYALYLVNYSIVLLTLQRFLESSGFLVIVFLVLSIGLAELLYRCIEIPFLKYREKQLPRL